MSFNEQQNLVDAQLDRQVALEVGVQWYEAGSKYSFTGELHLRAPHPAAPPPLAPPLRFCLNNPLSPAFWLAPDARDLYMYVCVSVSKVRQGL
jgi:hypothetical protein